MTLPLPDWQIRQSQLRADALSFLNSTPSTERSFNSILLEIEELAKTYTETDSSAFFSTVGLPKIALRLQVCGLRDWASALEKRSNTVGQVTEPIQSAVEILIGRAAGALCGRTPDDRRFTFVRGLREVIPFRSTDFLTAAENAMNASSDAKAALATMLRQRAADFRTNPNRIAHILGQTALSQLADDQPQDIRFADVWEGPFQRAVIWLHDVNAYELLRRTDQAAYLDLLEEFPLKGGIYELLEAADTHATTSEMCILLRNARSVFNADGEWIRKHRVAFIVLNFLGGRLLELTSEAPEPTEAFKATLVEILEALSERADATPLGYAWLQRLLVSGGRSRRRPAVTDSAALLRIAVNLSPLLPPHPTPMDWIAAEQEVWRNDRLYALLAIEICREAANKTQVASLIEQAVLSNLVSTVGIDRLPNDPKCIERHIIANSIACIPDPAAWFHNLWARLFWLRDRTRGFRHSNQMPTNAGQVIAVWTACGLELIDAASMDARMLWVELNSAVRESCLTSAFRQHNDSWSLTRSFLAGVWLKTFPDDPPPGSPGSLEDFIAPWIGVDSGFAQLALVLNRCGVEPKRLFRAGVSADILRLIVDDGNAMGRSIFSKPEVEAIYALADKLDKCDCVTPSGE